MFLGFILQISGIIRSFWQQLRIYLSKIYLENKLSVFKD